MSELCGEGLALGHGGLPRRSRGPISTGFGRQTVRRLPGPQRKTPREGLGQRLEHVRDVVARLPLAGLPGGHRRLGLARHPRHRRGRAAGLQGRRRRVLAVPGGEAALHAVRLLPLRRALAARAGHISKKRRRVPDASQHVAAQEAGNSQAHPVNLG